MRTGSIVLAAALVAASGCVSAKHEPKDAEQIAAEVSQVRDQERLSQALGDAAAVTAVLEDFHRAAAAADFDRYFGHFAPGAVFLGTDATERWTLEEFKAYTRPHFAKGHGWTYTLRLGKRTIFVRGECAWFDELLDNEKYGECRGSGVLVNLDGEWKIAQYNLTVPIPNDLLPRVAEMIRTK